MFQRLRGQHFALLFIKLGNLAYGRHRPRGGGGVTRPIRTAASGVPPPSPSRRRRRSYETYTDRCLWRTAAIALAEEEELRGLYGPLPLPYRRHRPRGGGGVTRPIRTAASGVPPPSPSRRRRSYETYTDRCLWRTAAIALAEEEEELRDLYGPLHQNPENPRHSQSPLAHDKRCPFTWTPNWFWMRSTFLLCIPRSEQRQRIGSGSRIAEDIPYLGRFQLNRFHRCRLHQLRSEDLGCREDLRRGHQLLHGDRVRGAEASRSADVLGFLQTNRRERQSGGMLAYKPLTR